MRSTLEPALRGVLVLALLLTALGAGPARAAGPTSTGPPVVSGTAEVGETLTVSDGTWEGPTLSLTYAWQRCADAPYAPEVLADEPRAYYRLGDEAGSSVLTDASGGEALGAFRNGVALEAEGAALADSDGAASFDGVDDLAEVPDAAALDVADAFTLEAWVRPAVAGPAALVDKGPGGYALRLAADGALVLAVSPAGTIAASTAAVPADGAFHHVVAAKEGAAVRLYLDGADVTGAVAPGTVADTGEPLRIAAGAGGAPPFAGELDEVAVYRGALPEERVRAHWDAGSAGCVAVPGAAGSAYAVSPDDHGAPLRAVVTATGADGSTRVASAATAPVTTRVPVSVEPPAAWGEALVGRVLVAHPGVWAGLEPLEHAYRWQRCVERAYRTAVLADGPSGWWRLGELAGTTAADDSGRGGAGTYRGGVELGAEGALAAAGDGNRAARFDGEDDHVAVADRAALDVGDSLTLEAWVRPDAGGARAQLFQKGRDGFALSLDASDRVRFSKSNVADVAVSTASVPPDGSFHHVVATKNGSTVRIYLDGEDVTSLLGDRTFASTSAPLQLGRHVAAATGAASRHLDGDLDEAAVYDHALSPARVRAHRRAGTSGCSDVAGATGAAYEPTAADVGTRLRVVVAAGNEAGSAEAASGPTQAAVAAAGGPAIVAGTLADAQGAPVAGAAVSVHLWPAAAAGTPVGGGAGTLLVGETTTDAAGNYAVRGPATPAIRAEADQNGGVVNFEVRAEKDGLLYETFVERDFGAPEAEEPESLAGAALAEAGTVWQEGASALPADAVDASLEPGEPGVAGLAGDPPEGGVECSDWDKTFRLWKKTGQGEAYTRVGELHTWSTMTNRFSYGTRADSHIDVAFKVPGTRWRVNGSVHVGNSSGQDTAAGVQASTGVGEYTSRAVRARFVYTHWYQCGTGNKKSRAQRWNGYSLGKGGRVHSRDGECSSLRPWIFEPGQSWERSRNRAVHWSAAADLGFFVIGARSGYSTNVRSRWWFGSRLASRVLCGVSEYPDRARRVYAGW